MEQLSQSLIRKDSATSGNPDRHLGRWLMFSVIAVNLLVLFFGAISLFNNYRQTVEQAEIRSRNLAEAVKRTIGSEVEKIDIVVSTVVDEMERDLRSGGIRYEQTNKFIRRQLERTPEIQGLRVADRDGNIFVGTGTVEGVLIDITERDYFKAHLSKPDLGLVVDKPVIGRIDKQWTVLFSRRYNATDGSFAGVVVASLPVNTLRSLLSSFELGAKGLMTIRAMDDLSLVVRHPEVLHGNRPEIGSKVTSKELTGLTQSGVMSATYHAVTPYDSTERVFSFSSLDKAPFFALAGLAADDYLAQWRAERNVTVLFMVAFVLVSSLGSRVLWLFFMRSRRDAERSRLLLRGASDSIYILDARGDLLEASDSFCHVLGYTRSELVGMNVNQWDTQYSLDEIRLLAGHELAQSNSKTYESRHRRSDGSLIDVEITVQVFEMDGHEVFFNASRDITERKLADEALRISENQFRDIFNHAPIGYHEYNSEGVIIRVNQTELAMLGYSEDEMLGHYLWEFVDNSVLSKKVAMEKLAGIYPPNVNLERKHCKKDGTKISTLTHDFVCRDHEGKITSIRTTLVDITDRKLADEALRMSENRYRAIFDTSLDVININRLSDGRLIEANQFFFDIQGYERDEAIGHTASELNIWFDPLERQRFVEMLQRDSKCTNLEARFRKKNGELIWGLVSASVVELDGIPCIVSIRRDITDRKLADQALQTSENQFREIFDEAPIGYHQFDTEGRITRVNHTELASLGYSVDEMLGHYVWEFVEGSDLSKKAVLNKLAGILTPTTTFERIFRRKDGTNISMLVQDKILRDNAGKITGIRSVVMDITERKRAEEKINQLAFFDQLTGLPNRTLLQDRLKQAMASSLRSGRYGALLLIDLDYFKTLNDTLGHDMGDLLLKQVAHRLTECVREEDTVARQGGDEFVVMLVSLSESHSEAAALVEQIAGKINAALNQFFELKDVTYRITPSIGASVFLGQQTDIDTLLKQADLAMYKAKEAGRNTLRFFDPVMAQDALKRAALDKELREAVLKQQFLLHYQAQVTGGQVTGVEALLRWQHPVRGLVFPGEFISLIEETGLILPVGQWVLDIACKQLADWATQADMSHLTVAVNISARQLNHEAFVDQVLMALDCSGANPERLKLELTESLLVNNVEEIICKMTALKAKGVGFSLDDFGTGYSSLSYLKRLPLDQLKIDQSFVRDILTDPNDAAIAKMIVVLAESLGLAVIAEGVETEAQRDSLTQHGCDAYQGYFFSRPLPLDEFESFVKQV